MKKTILVILMMLIITTPCLAQEVEPEGMFSIEGTQWKILPGLQIFPFPWIWTRGTDIGFWDGEVYAQAEYPYYKGSFYVDMLGVSMFMYEGGGGPFVSIGFGVVQPMGIGMMMESWIAFPPYSFTGIFPDFSLAIIPLIKTDDDWIPPNLFHSITPNSGCQGTTLTDVRLSGINTTFQDNSPVFIRFDSPDELTVSNINVISNTEIEFALEIAIDAPIGLKSVSVEYDNFHQVVTGIYAFEVLEQTN